MYIKFDQQIEKAAQEALVRSPHPLAHSHLIAQQAGRPPQPVKRILPDGTVFEGSLESLYGHLVERWAEAKENWFENRLKKRDECIAKFGDNKEAEEAINEWYEAVAEGRILEIEARYHSLVSIFSPDEFAEIMAILSCGNSGRFEEAKELVESIRWMNAKGGYTYPVDFEPKDWYKALESNLGYLNILDSPENIVMQIRQKHELLRMQTLQLNALAAMVPEGEDLRKKLENLKNAQTGYDTEQKNLEDTYTDNTVTVAKIVLAKVKDAKSIGKDDVTNALKGKDGKGNGEDLSALGTEINEGKADNNDPPQAGGSPRKDWTNIIKPEDFDKLGDAQHKVISAQNNLINSANAAVTAATEYLKDAVRADLAKDLRPYFDRLKDIAADIDDLEKRLSVASVTDKEIINKMTSDEVSNRFMEVNASFKLSEASQQSSKEAMSSFTRWDVPFFFGGIGGSSSKNEATSTIQTHNSDTEIQIGFLATKVNIIRPWFNPGLFKLCGNMKRISKAVVSKGSLLDSGKLRGEVNDAILPAFPVAFVIAKDITIKFDQATADTETMQKTFNEHSAIGGGFFCFCGSHAESKSGESKSFSSRVQGKSIVIRIPGVQILGWYLQATPKDDSSLYSTNFLSKNYEEIFGTSKP